MTLKLNGIEAAAITYQPGDGLVVVLKHDPGAEALERLEGDLRRALRDSPFRIIVEEAEG